jgi:hypothetical protein
MNLKQMPFKAALLSGAVALLTLAGAGCGFPGAPTAADNGASRATNYYQCWVVGSMARQRQR